MNKLFKHIRPLKALRIFAGLCLLTLLWPIPNPLFTDPTAQVILSNDGQLLSAHIAADGQWRFPESDSIPNRYEQCLLQYEDAHFYQHPGINPVSILKAFVNNIRAGKIISGGSTITMQLARMQYQNQKRTVWQKLKEIHLALRIELWHNKTEILNAYASHAPFGGNVVGLDAAAWRYYGRNAYQLSWAETATLAVLPNAPGLIHPGRNREALIKKRNSLLDKLWLVGIIDSTTCILSKDELIPEEPKPLPNHNSHLLQYANQLNFTNKVVLSTIDYDLQLRLNALADRYGKTLARSEIHNLAILVIDNKTQSVLAYVGNAPSAGNAHGGNVDIIQAKRSTGSVLKPFLFAATLDIGLALPKSYVKDIPVRFSGFAPKNYNKTFEGVLPYNSALTKSLNVPFVLALRKYGLYPFKNELNQLGLQSINRSVDDYGLSLILGGAESSLWEMCRAYTYLSNHLSQKKEKLTEIKIASNQHYNPKPFEVPYSQGAIYETLDALTELNRPGSEQEWQGFLSARKIAWKTGTSFGHRDAWAIGTTPEYTVGVWVGNADGEGRPGLTGTQVAGPILFEAFAKLPNSKWFLRPNIPWKNIKICSQTGYRASKHCPNIVYEKLPEEGLNTPLCPYHKTLFVNEDKTAQVRQHCYDGNLIEEKWLCFGPTTSAYYRRAHADYKSPPPMSINCQNETKDAIDLIYPERNAQLFIPKMLDGTYSHIVFEAAHINSESTIYWHLNDAYLGETKGKHKQAVYAEPGTYTLNLVDESGLYLTRQFEILARPNQ